MYEMGENGDVREADYLGCSLEDGPSIVSPDCKGQDIFLFMA